LVGHKSTTVTELIYRKQLRPVVQTGAIVMDGIFGAGNGSHAVSHSERVSKPEASEEGLADVQ
jgi:hypothetical protein